jgi:hypothetical protein
MSREVLHPWKPEWVEPREKPHFYAKEGDIERELTLSKIKTPQGGYASSVRRHGLCHVARLGAHGLRA